MQAVPVPELYSRVTELEEHIRVSDRRVDPMRGLRSTHC